MGRHGRSDGRRPSPVAATATACYRIEVGCRARVWLVASLLAGCGSGDDGNNAPPPIAGATSGGDTGTITVASGTLDPPPDPCAPSGADSGGADDESGADDGFKFDVGGPDGSVGFSLSCDDVADAPSNLGCTFWAVDLPNDERGTQMSPPAAEQPFAVVVANVSALGDAAVEVFAGNDDTPLAAATLAPLATHVFDLGQANISAAASSTGGVAFRVQSDVPIAAYQFNPAANTVEVYSNDASLLLPENALGVDYTAATADGILLGMGPGDDMPVNAGAFVAVVATVDGTTVEFAPTASLVGDIGDSVTLDRGEVATIVSDALAGGAGNLSGARVHASAPVAVFSGNVATAIPASTSVCCADHLEHQLLPATAWGNAYAVAPPPDPDDGGDAAGFYRILAGDEGAELRWCPTRPEGAPESLEAGGGTWFSSAAPFTVESLGEGESFSITQFTLSNTELGISDLGDPSMIVLPPAGQHAERSLFAVPAGYAASWANVVVRGDGEVRLDGDVVDDDQFGEVGTLGGVIHRYVRIELDAGTHSLEAEAPAGVTVIGVGEAVGYGFAGASGVRALSLPPAAG